MCVQLFWKTLAGSGEIRLFRIFRLQLYRFFFLLNSGFTLIPFFLMIILCTSLSNYLQMPCALASFQNPTVLQDTIIQTFKNDANQRMSGLMMLPVLQRINRYMSSASSDFMVRFVPKFLHLYLFFS